jgi:RsmE family RNA methyltransferase
MNLVLFERGEETVPLGKEDPRGRHITEVLKAKEGSFLTAGIVNGPIGRMEILGIEEKKISFLFIPEKDPPPLHPLQLIIGAPRPLVTKRLLKDLSSLGVGTLHFVTAELCEKSYLESAVWKTGEYLRYLKQGAEQSVSTLLPEVHLYPRLEICLKALPPHRSGIVLDPEEKKNRLQNLPPGNLPLVLAVGPERGWVRSEISRFEAEGFLSAGLGQRILRTEAVCLLASGIVLSRRGFI